MPLFSLVVLINSAQFAGAAVVIKSFHHEVNLNFGGYVNEGLVIVSKSESYSGSGAGPSLHTQISDTGYWGSDVVIQSTVAPFSISVRPDHLEDVGTFADITAEWIFSGTGAFNLDIFGALGVYMGGSGGWNRVGYSLAQGDIILASDAFYNESPGEDWDEVTFDKTDLINARHSFNFEEGQNYTLTLTASTFSSDGTSLDVGAFISSVPETGPGVAVLCAALSVGSALRRRLH